MEYTLVIEKGKDQKFIASVVELPGCYSEGVTLDDLLANIKEAIQLYIETKEVDRESEFVGIQKVSL